MAEHEVHVINLGVVAVQNFRLTRSFLRSRLPSAVDDVWIGSEHRSDLEDQEMFLIKFGHMPKTLAIMREAILGSGYELAGFCSLVSLVNKSPANLESLGECSVFPTDPSAVCVYLKWWYATNRTYNGYYFDQKEYLRYYAQTKDSCSYKLLAVVDSDFVFKQLNVESPYFLVKKTISTPIGRIKHTLRIVQE